MIVHRLIDVVVRWVRIAPEQRCCCENLPGLAVAALGHVELDPRPLHRMLPGRIEPLDCRHLFRTDGGNRCEAAAQRLAVDMDRARGALADAAAVLRADEAE